MIRTVFLLLLSGRTIGLSALTLMICQCCPAYGQQLIRKHEFEGDVRALAFAPHGKTYAIALFGPDPVIQLHHVSTGQLTASLPGGLGYNRSVGFHPKCNLLAFAIWGANRSESFFGVRIWDLAKNRNLVDLKGHKSPVLSLSFSSDGKVLASGDGKGAVRIWSLPTGKLVGTIKGLVGPVVSLAFAPDGATLAVNKLDTTIIIWDVKTKSIRKILKQKEKGRVVALIFSLDGKQLFAGDAGSGTINMWDVEKGIITRRLSLHGQLLPLTSIAFSPNLHLIASGSKDSTIKVWSMKTGGLHSTLKHADGCRINSMSFAPDCKHLLSGGTIPLLDEKADVRLWYLNKRMGRQR